MIRVARLRTRVIICSVAMLALVEVLSFAVLHASNAHEARVKIEDELEVGQRVLTRLLRQNAQALSQSARVLTADFAFREAVVTHDPATITAALENQGDRPQRSSSGCVSTMASISGMTPGRGTRCCDCRSEVSLDLSARGS